MLQITKAAYKDYFIIGKEIGGRLEILCMELLTEKMVSDALNKMQSANANSSTKIGVGEPYA